MMVPAFTVTLNLFSKSKRGHLSLSTKHQSVVSFCGYTQTHTLSAQTSYVDILWFLFFSTGAVWDCEGCHCNLVF